MWSTNMLRKDWPCCHFLLFFLIFWRDPMVSVQGQGDALTGVSRATAVQTAPTKSWLKCNSSFPWPQAIPWQRRGKVKKSHGTFQGFLSWHLVNLEFSPVMKRSCWLCSVNTPLHCDRADVLIFFFSLNFPVGRIGGLTSFQRQGEGMGSFKGDLDHFNLASCFDL